MEQDKQLSYNQGLFALFVCLQDCQEKDIYNTFFNTPP